MKKLFFVAAVTVAFSGLTAFGQGNFVFATGARFVWTGTGAGGVPGVNFNVAFLWTSTLSATPLIASIAECVPTNGLVAGDLSLAWNYILSDPNFQLGRDAGNANAIAVGTLTGTGAITYNLASPFGVTGTSTGGGSVMIFFIAWSNAFATPAEAAAAAGWWAPGWSRAFLYQYASTSVSPTAMGTQAGADGVDARFGLPIPEPSMFALAGLGAAAMLIFRRRTPAFQPNQKTSKALI